MEAVYLYENSKKFSEIMKLLLFFLIICLIFGASFYIPLLVFAHVN